MYKSEIAICDGVLRLDVDHVYARSSIGNQSTITQLLNQNFNQIQTVTAGHSDDCVQQVFRTLCNFYLPPCGNSTHPVPPSSICPEECKMVQNKCQLTWDAVMLFLTLDPIIYCNDTSQLLFPIPHCCTDAGLGLCLVLSLTVTVYLSPSLHFSKQCWHCRQSTRGKSITADTTGLDCGWSCCLYPTGCSSSGGCGSTDANTSPKI